MDLLSKLKEVANASEFIESKNYYFQTHLCGNDNVKVMFDYTLSNDKDDRILRFGICPNCGRCFYHNDYESKGF